MPLLVHGDLSIGESRVMLDYLAEAYAFEHAYPTEVMSAHSTVRRSRWWTGRSAGPLR